MIDQMCLKSIEPHRCRVPGLQTPARLPLCDWKLHAGKGQLRWRLWCGGPEKPVPAPIQCGECLQPGRIVQMLGGWGGYAWGLVL